MKTILPAPAKWSSAHLDYDEDMFMTTGELIRVAVFEGKHIRKIIHEGEWWFSVIDIVEVLTGSNIPKRYWSDLKKKLAAEGFTEAYEKIVRLKMLAPDGKMRLTDCANTETMFRIIQSIPSPKVEPLKRWLAKMGKERLDEIENPELSMERMKTLYEKKGYDYQASPGSRHQGI